MAGTSRTEVYPVEIEKLYNTIINYADYPEFVDGVHKVEVLEQTPDGAKVKYFLNLIKEFTYVLTLKHQKPNRVSWEFESGDLFKQNDGFWELKDLGEGKTEVTYSLDLNFKMMVPKMILGKLTAKNLPAMMDSMVERAKRN